MSYDINCFIIIIKIYINHIYYYIYFRFLRSSSMFPEQDDIESKLSNKSSFSSFFSSSKFFFVDNFAVGFACEIVVVVVAVFRCCFIFDCSIAFCFSDLLLAFCFSNSPSFPVQIFLQPWYIIGAKKIIDDNINQSSNEQQFANSW